MRRVPAGASHHHTQAEYIQGELDKTKASETYKTAGKAKRENMEASARTRPQLARVQVCDLQISPPKTHP